MDFENRTPHSAILFRGIIRDNQMFGSLACRIKYDIVAGELLFSANQDWPVSPGPWMSPQGPFAPDELFYRGGVDLFVFGSACAPGNRPVAQMEVSIQIGTEFQRKLAVFGDRIWEKRNGAIVPSAPQPFTAMPLTLQNAYGGHDEWDELPIPFGSNPVGKGFIFQEETAIGKPLPHIENPDHLIQSWTDQPEPVGFCAPPPVWPLRVAKFIEFDPATGMMKKIDPKFFNTCFPDMIVPHEMAQPGTMVVIHGMHPQGPLTLRLPPTPIEATIHFDDVRHQAIPFIDQIGIDTEQETVFITYRHAFRYRIQPLVKRWCELHPRMG
jgi:hypothetical protein